jgi:hypothetical protein
MNVSNWPRARTWIVSAVSVVVLISATIVLWTCATRLLRERLAASSLSPASHETKVPQAKRAAAWDALRAARYSDAFDFFRLPEARQWEAGDCFELASALLKTGRPALGWAALEAAHRIDATHAPTAQALDLVQAQLALAKGPERARQHETASRVEVLRLIPGGHQLGMLVLGLAHLASTPDQEDDILDRLGVRERALLRGVKTSGDALKLLARLLLETGRPTEARNLLELLVASHAARDDTAPSGGPAFPDREAAWLLSRAALQLGQHDTADAMLELAGDFGKTAAALPEPAPFIGARRCGECHRRIYHEQQRDSRHATTLRLGSGLKDVPLPDHPVPDPMIPSISYQFSRKSEDHIELESRVDGRVVRAIVAYAVGSGRHGITMLARDDEGVDRELRISYFGQTRTWGPTKGIEFGPADAGTHIGIGLARKSLHHCLHCHTTWFRSVDQSLPGPRGPEAYDRGIGCERCHGPGLNHDKAVEAGFAELAIALGAESASIQRLTSCVECHAADGTVQPSDPEFTRAQGTTFLFSRCFTASKDRFACTTCHDPHRPVDTETIHYEAKCLGCHSALSAAQDKARKPDRPAGGIHQTGPICPVNPAAKCISCHMPKVEDPSRRSQFTDHHIRIHREAIRSGG